jgi:hypothetical protein
MLCIANVVVIRELIARPGQARGAKCSTASANFVAVADRL